MNTKLSQAVQLYDHLLNEQLSQRTYSSPAPQAQVQMQTPYQAQNQWDLRRTASPSTSYNPTYNQTHTVPQQSQWTPVTPSAHQTTYNAAPAVTSPVVQYQTPQQHQTYQSLPPVTVQPYQAQPQTQPSAPPQTVTSPPPVPISAPPTVTSTPGVWTPMQTPTLSRHVSLAHRPSSMAAFPPQRAGTGLHRSSTISSSATSYTAHPQQTTYNPIAQQQQQSAQTPAQPQQQHVQPHQVPVQVPVFPTAPTNAPATYSLFGAPQVPVQQPREEPKEALLIEL
jgi:growth factor-regulated tyrosine kinase substrate